MKLREMRVGLFDADWRRAGRSARNAKSLRPEQQ